MDVRKLGNWAYEASVRHLPEHSSHHDESAAVGP